MKQPEVGVDAVVVAEDEEDVVEDAGDAEVDADTRSRPSMAL